MRAIPTGTSAAKKKKNQVKSPSIWSRTPNSVWIRQSGRTGNRGVTDKAAEEAEWLRNFLEDIPVWPKPVTAICIHYDSMAAQARAKINIYNGKSRHIRRRHNTIKQLLSSGVITIQYIKSKENLADPLTKGLPREQIKNT